MNKSKKVKVNKSQKSAKSYTDPIYSKKAGITSSNKMGMCEKQIPKYHLDRSSSPSISGAPITVDEAVVQEIFDEVTEEALDEADIEQFTLKQPEPSMHL